MVRYITVLFLCFTIVSADSLHRELENILGHGSYIAKRKFLNILFKDSKKFTIGNHVDIDKVLQVLENNNLLKSDTTQNKELFLSFATKDNNPLVFIKMIRDSLNSLGYSKPQTVKVLRDHSGFLYKLKLVTSSSIDPLLLSQVVKRYGCHITKVKKYSKSNWRYNVDISDIDVVPKNIKFNEKVNLKKPLNPYWLDVQGAKKILIGSSRINSWHPYIVFYDKNLNALDIISKEIKSYNESLTIPSSAKYVKISDIYTLNNLRRGLIIYLSKR